MPTIRPESLLYPHLVVDPLSNPAFRQLPPEALALLSQTNAPPRLMAHLVLVHDVACRLIEQLSQRFPSVAFDRNAVLFGAATHDIGKALETNELVQPGEEHEERGFRMLVELGIPEQRARFAYTHGNWDSVGNATLEDLLVALADKCWKGKRVDELETKTVEILSSATGKPAWDCYSVLDDILESLAVDADARLEWQRQFKA